MRPLMARPGSTRANSAAPPSHPRLQSGTVSPADSMMSTTTNATQTKSPHGRSNTGLKRKERDFDSDECQESNIHVVVRCRGRSEREVKENSGVVVSTNGVKSNTVELSMGPSALSNKTYHFDTVFSPAADQSMIYDDVVTPILDEVRNIAFVMLQMVH